MTTTRDPHQLAREAEAELKEIHGVRDVRMSMNAHGEVLEVHVVADARRRGKELVRDVETVLRASFDLEVDHRRISVARVGSEAEAVPTVDVGRVRLAGVSLRIGDSAGTAEVELARNGTDATGTASGAAIGGAWQRLVAGATLDAAARFLPGGVGLSLGTVNRSYAGVREVIMVTVDFAASKETRELIGSAFLGPDVHRSVAQATLDAVNRVLARSDAQIETITFLEPPL